MYYTKLDVNNCRAQLRNQMDNFTTFTFGGRNMYEDFGAFIINEKEGGLRMYNGPSFSNSYTKTQFSSEGNFLSGVNFNVQTLEFKIGVYYVTIAEYRKLLDLFDPYAVENLSFSFNPDWHYQVKLKNIQDSPKYILSSKQVEGKKIDNTAKEFTEYYYYTELKLVFELQGAACLYANMPYIWGIPENSSNPLRDYAIFQLDTNKSDNYHEGDSIIRSDLDFPFDIKIPFRPIVDKKYMEKTDTKTPLSRVTAQGDWFKKSISNTCTATIRNLEIKGQTVVKNQLLDPTYGTQILNGVTFERLSDGSWKVYGTATGGDAKKYVGYLTQKNHYYLLRGCPKGGSLNTYAFIQDKWDNPDINPSGNGDFGEGTVTKYPYSWGEGAMIYVKEGYTADNLIFKPELIDLTRWFSGVDVPTTLTDAYKKGVPTDFISYTTGELVSSNITSLTSGGANVCDQDFMYGFLTSTGYPVESPEDHTLLVSNNYLKVFGGMPLSYKWVENAQRWLQIDFFFYDDSEPALNVVKQYTKYNNEGTINIPTNATRMKIQISNYQNDFTLPVSGLQVQYGSEIPTKYTEFNPVYDIVEINSGELRGVNNVHDTITKDKKITRFGILDLGDYTWNQFVQDNRFNINIPNEMKVVPDSVVFNGLCNRRYETTSNDATWGNKYIISQSSGTLAIQDMEFAKADEFNAFIKTAGIKLVYELKEPIVETTPLQDYSYKAYNKGIEAFDQEKNTIAAIPTINTTIFYHNYQGYKNVFIDIDLEINKPKKGSILINLLHCQLANLYQTLVDPDLLANTFYIHYYSDSGIVLYSKGDATDTLLSLMSSGSNGKRLVEILESHKFLFEHDTDLSQCKIVITLKNAQFDMSSNDAPNIEINSYARTRIA